MVATDCMDSAAPVFVRPSGPTDRTRHPCPSEKENSEAYSIFHEAWWLDCVAPGAWQEVQVASGDGTMARWPFYLRRRGGLLVSVQPPLTRTLGPVLNIGGGGSNADFRRRLRLTNALISHLPRVHLFQQTFDLRIKEAVAFCTLGFEVRNAYTFRIEHTTTADHAWAQMTDKTRNVIRRADEQLDVVPIDDPHDFCAFYDANLAAADRSNMYGAATMRRLTSAFMARGAGRLLGGKSGKAGLVAAIALVWDGETTYFLLSSRSPAAHSGAISLLVWRGIRESLAAQRTFDFDGIASPSVLQFLSGFGGILAPRLVVQRSTMLYDAARLVHRVLRGGNWVPHPL
jgi:Acetyltransferase (GNAT) domain